jgi:hypothetical protein
MLPDLAAACRKSGLRVFELPGWSTRGRPASTGGFDPRGVLVHHTGSSRDDTEFVDWMATVGRSDLPAPLCQLALSRNGTVYVCAAGRANHGGTAQATGPMPSGDGNSLYIGIEALNTGSEGWTDTQYDAYVALCAALCSHYNWPATHVRAHRETSITGKWDPGLLDMDRFRTDIATRMKKGLTMDKEVRAAFDSLKAEVASVRDAIGALRVKEAGRHKEQIREMRAQGRTADEILAELEQG